MSARKAYGVCPVGARKKARYRNRKAARAGLDTVRQDCRKAGMPAEVWPVDVYRCPRREDGGCHGWHLRSSREDAENYIRGRLRGRPFEVAPELAGDVHEHHDAAELTAAA